jgi:hypothetical protein
MLSHDLNYNLFLDYKFTLSKYENNRNFV